MNVLIAYDGTVHAKKALAYGIEKTGNTGGRLTVLLIFDRGPFVGYDAVPGAEEMARREFAGKVQDVKRLIRETATGASITVLSAEGEAAEVLSEVATKEPYDYIIVPLRYKAAARSLSRPVLLLSGTILVPVDGSGAAADVETIRREASAISAKVLLLGIVPEHLFSGGEKTELASVRQATEETVRTLRAELANVGIEAMSIIRSGYPDEEILSTAMDHNVSLILLPTGGAVPSELSKAASMLQDEPQRLRWPLSLYTT